MRRLVPFVVVVATVAGCASLPSTDSDEPLPSTDYGEPPAACGDAFAPDMELEWAGEGDGVALGLYDAPPEGFPERTPRPGDVYVGRANPAMPPDWHDRGAFCIVYQDDVERTDVEVGPLREGWRAP